MNNGCNDPILLLTKMVSLTTVRRVNALHFYSTAGQFTADWQKNKKKKSFDHPCKKMVGWPKAPATRVHTTIGGSRFGLALARTA